MSGKLEVPFSAGHSENIVCVGIATVQRYIKHLIAPGAPMEKLKTNVMVLNTTLLSKQPLESFRTNCRAQIVVASHNELGW